MMTSAAVFCDWSEIVCVLCVRNMRRYIGVLYEEVIARSRIDLSNVTSKLIMDLMLSFLSTSGREKSLRGVSVNLCSFFLTEYDRV